MQVLAYFHPVLFMISSTDMPSRKACEVAAWRVECAENTVISIPDPYSTVFTQEANVPGQAAPWGGMEEIKTFWSDLTSFVLLM